MKILAFTVSYGDRRFLDTTISHLRATAGCWFDWHVYLGAPHPILVRQAEAALDHPKRLGIQRLTIWEENRGQHHAMARALEQARQGEYTWLLRLDDDIRPKTTKWLKRMVEGAEALRAEAKDPRRRLVVVPKIIGLKNPIQHIGAIGNVKGLDAEVLEIAGGACRLHPVELFEDFEPPLYLPTGRGDPESIAEHVRQREGVLVRFPRVRLVHSTEQLEAADSHEQAHLRRMSFYWPYLGPGV